MTSRQELREKIVQLRKQRDSHQIDESDYIDGVMAEIDRYVESRDKEVLELVNKDLKRAGLEGEKI